MGEIVNDWTTVSEIVELLVSIKSTFVVRFWMLLPLQPKDTLTATVSFLSSTEGLKKADLTYNPVGIGCGNISTHLKATGSNTDLTYEEVNFAKKRIQTVNSLNLEISTGKVAPAPTFLFAGLFNVNTSLLSM